MGDIVRLLEIDYAQVFTGIFAIILGVFAITSIAEKLFEKFGIEFGFQRKQKEVNKMLQEITDNISKIQQRQDQDVQLSDQHDAKLQEQLISTMDHISENQKNIDKILENRTHDREQSLEIQRQLSFSISELAEGQKERDKKIEALMMGSKELLGEAIDTRYSKYVSLGGIPESEINEFEDLHFAYKNLNGNHSRDAKYKYVKENLQVIPVVTKMIIEDED